MKKYQGHALITGGSSGIGLAFAHELARQGYNLVIVSNIRTELEDAKKALEAYGVEVISLFQDLSDSNSTDLIYNTLQAKNIHIGLLINNAGFVYSGLFHKLDQKKLIDMIRVMVISLTELTYKFLPQMLEKGEGGIIINSSISAQLLSPYNQVYGSVKAYSLKFGESLHAQYLNSGIDILTICPALVKTNIYKNAGYNTPWAYPLISPMEVVHKSLAALGKKIVINIYGDQKKLKFLALINRFLSRQLIERITRLMIKR